METDHFDREYWRVINPEEHKMKIRNWRKRDILTWFSIIALLIFIIGYPVANSDNLSIKAFVQEFYALVSTELLSVILIIIVLDYLNEKRLQRYHKAQLFFKVGSFDNATARDALNQLRYYGWFKEISSSTVDFANADLRGANLSELDLNQCFMWNTNLEEANLISCNLQNADLSGANLKNAKLIDADMRGAGLQFANLRGADLKDAKLQGMDDTGAEYGETTRLPNGKYWTKDLTYKYWINDNDNSDSIE